MDTRDDSLGSPHVVVTGAGTGIGRAIALRLAAEGATLTLLARDRARLEETASLAREASGTEVRTASCDIRDRAAVEAAFEAAVADQGLLTALVANSGVGGANAPGAEDRFEDMVATNLTGSYHCMRAAIQHLRPAGKLRHLVAISSILARIGVPGYSGYCASKAGLLGLVRSLAAELAPDGIQVNAVCPGWVDTAMARAGLEEMARGLSLSFEEARAMAMQQVPAGRMSTPEEVAGLVAWLISPDARGVTGQALDINGGAFMS
jgi:NAD(P)-dependent dehydrogenase (short-subunit alcohol dehydrogenase family)